MSQQTSKEDVPAPLEAQDRNLQSGGPSESKDRDPTLPGNHPINALGEWHKSFILCTLAYSGFLANFR